MISELPKDNNRLYNISMNRFDLEDAMSALYNLGDDIDIILHAYMDAKVAPTEDEMANMLIGVKALHEARYQKLWQTFEALVESGVISNKNCELVYKSGKVPWKWEEKNDKETDNA